MNSFAAAALCDVCAGPVDARVRRCELCQQEISEQLARMMEEPPEPRDLRRLPAKKPRGPLAKKQRRLPAKKAPAKKAPPVDDDEAIRMWELYDEGYTVGTVARKLGRAPSTVEAALRELDVWEGNKKPGASRPKKKPETAAEREKRRIDTLVQRMLDGELDEQEQNIADALARINMPDYGDMPERGFVPYARSMQHINRHARGPVIQSERQRRNGKVGQKWRSIIRMDLRRAGLLP
jgi:hypothetical protein